MEIIQTTQHQVQLMASAEAAEPVYVFRLPGLPAPRSGDDPVSSAAKRITVPNDPLFSEQWAHENTGQTGGTPDADIDTPEALAALE